MYHELGHFLSLTRPLDNSLPQMVVPADQIVFVSPCELPSEEQVDHSCMCETSHLKECGHQYNSDGMKPSNREAGIGENDNVLHPTLPLLNQH